MFWKDDGVIHKAMMSCERGGGRGFRAFQVLSFSDRHLKSQVNVKSVSVGSGQHDKGLLK